MAQAVEQREQEKAEEFAGKMVEVLNHAFLALMLSIGHQVELFDKMAGKPPATSAEIASFAGLNERYVREWLAAMTVGGMVKYDPATSTYMLPDAHAASLTRAAGTNNLAAPTQFLALLSDVEQKIAHSFRNGGGVPYSEYGRFQELMKQDSAALFDTVLIDSILPIVPGIVERLSSGIEVADIGTGSGHAINVMAQAFPDSRFTGFDIAEEGIAEGRAEARALGLANASFEVKDVASLDGSQKFDFMTAFDAIHDQAQPRRVLKGIADSLRDDGVFLCVDIAASSNLHENMDHPMAPFLYAVSTFHCMTVSLALDGEGLGTMWGEQKALELLAEAGFRHVDVRQVEGDFFNNYYIAKK
jgi:2-polyprenyl-3-methyl-5-hydroxy-6-metoxy-1,4-benzoquinol methylase